MTALVFFLEEPSAKEMLKGILPRILPETYIFDFKIFEGKQDMEKRLGRILKCWKKPDCRFMIIRDQDSEDCHEIKNKLNSICRKSVTSYILIRIACRELESFYLGDLHAVEQGLEIKGLSKLQKKKKFRNPDNLQNPFEELKKITNGKYQKISGSRTISHFLKVNSNHSHSFNVLVSGINKIISE